MVIFNRTTSLTLKPEETQKKLLRFLRHEAILWDINLILALKNKSKKFKKLKKLKKLKKFKKLENWKLKKESLKPNGIFL